MDDRIAALQTRICGPEGVEEAGRIIKGGGLVAFPTETVYGLGGNALDPGAARALYAAKGRPSDNPLIVHIADMSDLEYIVSEIPEDMKALAGTFWPGPLTFVMKGNGRVPLQTTGGLDTVAVRMPSDELALAFIRAAGGYVAGPSANVSGRPSPTRAEHVLEDLGGRIDMILDGGRAVIGLESTIVDVTGSEAVILRPGYITAEAMGDVLGYEVALDPGLIREGQAPKAPGMKYRHYAPQGEMTIVKGPEQDVSDLISQLAQEGSQRGEKVGILCSSESSIHYKELPKGISVRVLGSLKEELQIASDIYSALRDFDQMGITVIYSEGFEEKGLGVALMNRLKKAAGGHIIEA